MENYNNLRTFLKTQAAVSTRIKIMAGLDMQKREFHKMVGLILMQITRF